MAITKGAQIRVIGNETNSGWERPGNSDGNGGEVMTPAQFAQCFAKCRAAIKKLPGHTDDWIVPSAPAPWNPQTTYSGNSSGDWVKYFQDVLNQCVRLNAKPDALSIHTYTHGLDPSLLMISHPMDPPFQNRCFEFRAYCDFLGAIPWSLKTLPVLITETQAQFWQDSNVGWIQTAFKEMDDWNSVHSNQPIQAALSVSLAGFARRSKWLEYFKSPHARQRFPSRAPERLSRAHAHATAAARSGRHRRQRQSENVDLDADCDQAALYKFAQQNNLGYPQTDEFAFACNNESYIGQVFNLGIVYVKKDDWGNVQWVKKPS